ncbi:MAG: hypothetical protein KC729_21535, partial [Candidatus Eisenbacteria bacterium]|nr:hypothetical protein [Candidatus Eisenbacteria bacterium]
HQLDGAGEGTVVYHVHDAPHVDRPGAFVEAYAPMHSDEQNKAARVIVPIIAVAVLLAVALVFVHGRQPGFVPGTFDQILASTTAAPQSISFLDKLSPKLSDGRHFAIPLTRSSVLHKGTNAAIFADGSQAYFVQSDGIGSVLAAVMDAGINEIRFDTSMGTGDIRMVALDRQLIPAQITALAIATPQAATANADIRIRFDDPKSFAAGIRYAFEGGLSADGDRWILTHLPLENPPYRVILRIDDPGMRTLAGYIQGNRYRAVVSATLADPMPPKSANPERLIGTTANDVVITFSNRSYTAVGSARAS